MIRTRTIREAAAYFKETDPDTCLTETAIRTLLRTGAVPSARIGKKYLVPIEALEEYLSGAIQKPKAYPPCQQAGKVLEDSVIYGIAKHDPLFFAIRI